MNKKYKGKQCVYCAETVSVTGDHIFAREFLIKSQRQNLPKVPACNECNNKKSILEHYLTTILPFGALHTNAKQNLVTMVPKRLTKNQKLHNSLRTRMTYKTHEGMRRLFIPIDGNSILDLFKYIAKGLTWFHWNTTIKKTSFVFSTVITKTGEQMFNKYLLSLKAKNRVENTIGIDSFLYTGAQGVDTDQLTIWKFRIYGGLAMAEKNVLGQCIIVITGPSNIEDSIISSFK